MSSKAAVNGGNFAQATFGTRETTFSPGRSEVGFLYGRVVYSPVPGTSLENAYRKQQRNTTIYIYIQRHCTLLYEFRGLGNVTRAARARALLSAGKNLCFRDSDTRAHAIGIAQFPDIKSIIRFSFYRYGGQVVSRNLSSQCRTRANKSTEHGKGFCFFFFF